MDLSVWFIPLLTVRTHSGRAGKSTVVRRLIEFNQACDNVRLHHIFTSYFLRHGALPDEVRVEQVGPQTLHYAVSSVQQLLIP